MRPTKFVTGSVVDWSGETDGGDTSSKRSSAPPVIEFKEGAVNSSMRMTFKLSQGRDRPARLLSGSTSTTRLSSNPGLQVGRAHYLCNANAKHDLPSSLSPHADQIPESGETATDEKTGESQHPEAQHETQPRKLPHFVPAVMVGWLHTSTDRGLFVDAEDVDDPDEVLGPLPREIQMAGHELEEEFRRHRLAIVKLGRRRQPFFVTSEDALSYKEMMMAQPSNSPARFELSPRRDSASDPKTETTGKPQSEIIKIASLKTGLSLLCAFPERCCLVRSDLPEEVMKTSLKSQGDQQQESREHQGSVGDRGRSLADEAADAKYWRKEGEGMPGTPVFSIPGVYVTIGSAVGPIRMKPLFLCEEQLEGMVDTGKRAFTQASLTERRMNREQGRQRILRAFANIASGGRQPPPQQQGADQDEDEDDGAMDPPEVNEFLGEMDEGPSNRGPPGGFGPARGPISVVSTAACGVLAMGLGAAGALADLADNAIFATSVGRFLMGHYLPLTIEKDLLEEKVAEAAEHNRIQLGNSGYGTFNSRGPIVLTDEHASDAPGLQDAAVSEEIEAEIHLDSVPRSGEGVGSATGHRIAAEDASEASWKQQLDEGLDVVVRKNGVPGGRLTEREVTERLARILMRNRYITEVLERLDDNSFTGADISSIGVILQMAAMVSALQTSPISDSSMEMVLSTSKRTLEGSEKASGRDGATGPDVTNMEISQKDDGESDKFRFEISSFERSSGKNEESDGSVSSTMRRKMQSGAKKAHGESEGDDTSVSIEVDLREALGDLADDFLGDGNDGDPADAQPSTLPAAQGDGSKDVSDQRVQGFVLIGDLLVSDKAKNVNAPVDIGNIADVTRLCSISAPTQPWSNSRHGW